MFISTILFVLAITYPDYNQENCGNQIEIDPRYDINLNRTNVQKSMFYCHYDLMIFNSIVLDKYNKVYDKGKYNCHVFASYFNSIVNGFDEENGLRCRYASSHKDRLKNKRYLLAFQNSFYCKKGIEQLNFMVFNTGGVISCTGYGYIKYESSDKCREELYDNHNFEHLIRCASSEFGFPELPFRGKCICLPGSTGSYCQFSNQNTCNCNGKALGNGYCECDEGYEGFYCEVKKESVSSSSSSPTKTILTTTYPTNTLTAVPKTVTMTTQQIAAVDSKTTVEKGKSTTSITTTTTTQKVPSTITINGKSAKKDSKTLGKESTRIDKTTITTAIPISLPNTGAKKSNVESSENKKGSKNQGLVIGIIILGIVLVLFIAGMCIFFRNYIKKILPQAPQTPQALHEPEAPHGQNRDSKVVEPSKTRIQPTNVNHTYHVAPPTYNVLNIRQDESNL